ncbi:MAG: hypothetical protein CSA81_14245 [Acidobacteria bacterium]|nr:MAG: hypothetical protein CSA81_14245 [Acidobacteriota bacterium]
MLYLDEAHGTGLYGRRGLGVAEREDLLDQVDILIGTFGKALASIGAYVICPEVIKKYLLNKSRSLIFTTALPPVVGAWNLFAFREMMGMYSRRERLQMLSEKLRKSFIENGLETRGDTNIIPVIIGEDQRTEHIASQLQQDGFLLLPIRPPTVPEGTSRLRFSLTANMNWEQLQPVTDVVVSRM